MLGGIMTEGFELVHPFGHFRSQEIQDIKMAFWHNRIMRHQISLILKLQCGIIICIPAFMVMSDILRYRRTIVFTEVCYIA